MLKTISNNKIQRYLRKTGYKVFFGDRRCKFNDFSKIKPQNWQESINSPVMQFYSSVDNIGNYLPVLGIQKMLNHETDTWCIHDPKIDFDFINANYQYIIIGGAGLLHECFESFWDKVLNECKLPMMIWGVGVCLPDETNVRTDLSDSVKNSGVSRDTIAEIGKRCQLLNVRDDLTAEYYGLDDANISACPTVVYVSDFSHKPSATPQFLLSSHEELVSLDDQAEIIATVSSSVDNFQYTDNFQKTFQSLDEIINNCYCPSSVVITSRLHGAIISYGLGIPYIAIARDLKMREFHRLHGNGICLNSIDEIGASLDLILNHDLSMKTIDLAPVLDFGRLAAANIASYCTLQHNI